MIVKAGKEFLRAFNRLDNSEAYLVAKTLKKLKESDLPIGKQLRGPLSKCCSIRTGNGGRLRIVYSYHGRTAELIALGERAQGEVYQRASRIIKPLKR